MSGRRTLDIWSRLEALPAGKWLFGRLVCFKAPYFASIRPRFVELRPGCCEVAVRKRRTVLNHIGSVHAIAMCNMAELAAGTMTEVTIPPTHRWIPKGMTVEYLRKAATDVVAVARPVDPAPDWSVAGAHDVEVRITDNAGAPVFRAIVTMWISPKRDAARAG